VLLVVGIALFLLKLAVLALFFFTRSCFAALLLALVVALDLISLSSSLPCAAVFLRCATPLLESRFRPLPLLGSSGSPAPLHALRLVFCGGKKCPLGVLCVHLALFFGPGVCGLNQLSAVEFFPTFFFAALTISLYRRSSCAEFSLKDTTLADFFICCPPR
jgi:hypothetical protein